VVSPQLAIILALQVQRSLEVTSDTYTHVLVDKREVDLDGPLAPEGASACISRR
jgi:hypothetical protein